MKVCVKAWDDVINPAKGAVHNDEGLFALDAIEYGETHEVDSITRENRKNMVEDFKQNHPGRGFDHYEVLKV